MQHMNQTPASCALHVRCYGAPRGHTECMQSAYWLCVRVRVRVSRGAAYGQIGDIWADGLTVYLSENGRSAGAGRQYRYQHVKRQAGRAAAHNLLVSLGAAAAVASTSAFVGALSPRRKVSVPPAKERGGGEQRQAGRGGQQPNCAVEPSSPAVRVGKIFLDAQPSGWLLHSPPHCMSNFTKPSP